MYNLLSNSSKFTSEGVIEFDACIVDCSQREEYEDDGSTMSLSDSENYHDENEDDRLVDAEEGNVNRREMTNTKSKRILQVKVRDTGTGIAPHRLKYIFEPYSQAKLSDYRKYGGTGLGLSIISSLLELMGGTIEVESTEGKGSTFTVRMPLREGPTSTILSELPMMMDPIHATTKRMPVLQSKPSNHEDSPKSHQGEVPHFQTVSKKTTSSSTSAAATTLTPMVERSTTAEKRRGLSTFTLAPNDGVIMVVDDNLMNRKIVGRMLSSFGFEYECAANGQEAVDLMRKSRNYTGNPSAPQYVLAVVDLQMPVMDGFEAMRTMREDGIDIPLIALTANALSKEKEKALECGATAFHTKPILRKDLHTICVNFVGKRL